MLATQDGSWECQTSVCPFTFMPCCAANATMASARSKVKRFGVGSVASHFISFSGVA